MFEVFRLIFGDQWTNLLEICPVVTTFWSKPLGLLLLSQVFSLFVYKKAQIPTPSRNSFDILGQRIAFSSEEARNWPLTFRSGADGESKLRMAKFGSRKILVQFCVLTDLPSKLVDLLPFSMCSSTRKGSIGQMFSRKLPGGRLKLLQVSDRIKPLSSYICLQFFGVQTF